MSNSSVLNGPITNNKIIIEDDSDDSFNSYYSNKSFNKKSKIIKQPIKKSFLNKIKDNDNEIIVKNNKSAKCELAYNKKNYTIVNKTKEILEKSYSNYQNSLEKYYEDVLKWMNILYSDNSKSITKIKFKKMTLSEEIFNLYNQIIKKYKINKDLFDTEKFNLNDDHERNEIYLISKILTNNLLAKLDCKLVEYKRGNLKRLKVDCNTNCC